jgi:hypothetical protein
VRGPAPGPAPGPGLTDGTGDADGLGETRKKELVKSGMTLGLRKEDDVYVVESP